MNSSFSFSSGLNGVTSLKAFDARPETLRRFNFFSPHKTFIILQMNALSLPSPGPTSALNVFKSSKVNSSIASLVVNTCIKFELIFKHYLSANKRKFISLKQSKKNHKLL